MDNLIGAIFVLHSFTKLVINFQAPKVPIGSKKRKAYLKKEQRIKKNK
jgi:hypothetical protein